MAALNRWLSLLRIPLALVGIIALVVFYNRFILNANLQNLKTSLSILDTASGVGQAEAALLLVDQTLVAEMAREDIDLTRVATLQYVQGTLSSKDPGRRVEDTQVLVAFLAEDAASARVGLLATLDNISSGVQNIMTRASLLPRELAKKRSSGKKIDPAQMQQAAQWERLGQLPQAETLYEKLISEHPEYSGRATLKMRLGYVYQKSRKFDQAEDLYQQAVKEARTPDELNAAQQLMAQIAQIRKAEWTAKDLEQKLSSVKAGPDRQRMAFQLGSILIQIYKLSEAAPVFRGAYLADPKGELALLSLFKEAWCLKATGRLEEALKRFQEIIQQYPKNQWANLSYQQIAESYRASGDYDATAKTYEKSLTETEDAAYAATVHALVGSFYLFDLKQPDMAKFHFAQLAKMFPSSPFSNFEEQLQKASAGKGLDLFASSAVVAAGLELVGEEKAPTLSLEIGAPVIKWLESFLPIFVEVFADRLARYMELTGTAKLTRRYTEAEFKDLVLSRVQEKFADQIQDVDVKILPDGFVGSGKVKLGILSFPLEAKIDIHLVDDIPHAAIREIKAGILTVPEVLRKMLEEHVNVGIDKKNYPIRVKQYELSAGYALISVELVTKSSGTRPSTDSSLFRDRQ